VPNRSDWTAARIRFTDGISRNAAAAKSPSDGAMRATSRPCQIIVSTSVASPATPSSSSHTRGIEFSVFSSRA
jgi:hypothetical protein